jgi:hypothetical protein
MLTTSPFPEASTPPMTRITGNFEALSSTCILMSAARTSRRRAS